MYRIDNYSGKFVIIGEIRFYGRGYLYDGEDEGCQVLQSWGNPKD